MLRRDLNLPILASFKRPSKDFKAWSTGQILKETLQRPPPPMFTRAPLLIPVQLPILNQQRPLSIQISNIHNLRQLPRLPDGAPQPLLKAPLADFSTLPLRRQ